MVTRAAASLRWRAANRWLPIVSPEEEEEEEGRGGRGGGDMSVQVCCLSFRQPYAGLILDGVKTVESRWRPLLAPLENQTLAVHIAQRDWEGEEWRAVLSGPLGMNRAQIQALRESGERFGRGVVAGLVDVGGTWICPASLQEEELQPLERSAVLIGLQEKHLTHLSNPRWLKQPLSARGGRDLWTVEIPAELLP
ncbi:protein EOLA1 isoform X1 [Thunnus thynnus]|uniref:protein EOLA1 isoform X1 n=2 Tax=Thunnus thynnus TaxID=8237 RepID=UPI0035290237